MLYGALIGGLTGVIIAIVVMVMRKKGGDTPRFSEPVPFSGNFEEMLARIDALLKQNGFNPAMYKGEAGVYRKGNGALTAARYIKILPEQGVITVQGFVDVYGTESGLDGFTGAMPKKSCKKVVDQVIALIQNG